MNVKQKTKLVIKLWHDDQAESPCEGYGWKAYSFSRHHSNQADPLTIGFEEDEDGNTAPDKELQAKLDSGLAFKLSYFEHGLCAWSLAGEGSTCRWDSVSNGGLLVWEEDEDGIGAKTVEDRTKDARAFIDQYTEWCNGSVFGYTIEAFKVCECCEQDVELSGEEADLDLPSCGGYYANDVEGMVCDMKDNIGSDWADYEAVFKEENGFGLADEAKRLWKGE